MGLLEKYQKYLRNTGLKIHAGIWILFALVFALVISASTFVMFPDYPVLALLLFIVCADLLIAFPYLKETQRIDAIEENLPDALRQMSDTLRAGGTYEYALREIASSEYGPLRREMDKVLRKLEEGENFENAFSSLSQDVDSRLIQRTVTIIIDSVKAGAGLADLLEKIADDVRTMHRIGRERKSRTLLQTIFLFAAGAAVAPMIFGFTTTIVDVLVGSAAGAASSRSAVVEAKEAIEIIFIGVQFYIFAEIAAASAMIALMREGKLSKSLLYFPILIFIAYLVYIIAGIVSAIMITGAM